MQLRMPAMWPVRGFEVVGVFPDTVCESSLNIDWDD